MRKRILLVVVAICLGAALALAQCPDSKCPHPTFVAQTQTPRVLWEYDFALTYIGQPDDTRKMLTAHGDAGWEIISAEPLGTEMMHWVFRREK